MQNCVILLYDKHLAQGFLGWEPFFLIRLQMRVQLSHVNGGSFFSDFSHQLYTLCQGQKYHCPSKMIP